MIIAIDGPAGSGKSTVSRKVAHRLGFYYLDTGAMYRAITYKALQDNVNLSDELALRTIAEGAKIDFRGRPGTAQKVMLNGRDVTKAIRLPNVTKEVKHVAKFPAVREVLVSLQRRMAEKRNVVIEGRDTTTVVFPNATCKIYLEADIQERARRRFIELQEHGVCVTFEEVLGEQQKRDDSDIKRDVGALRKAPDAVIIDTTNLTIEEVVQKVLMIAKERRKDFSLYYEFMRQVCNLLIYICFKRTIHGRENIPKQGGFLLASNHASYLDPIVVGSACPRQLHYLARTSLYLNPFFGWFIRSVHAHPIKRGAADRRALAITEELLHSGKGVIFFPEGTRSKDGKLGRAKSGIGFVACRTGYPVVPAYVKGTFEAWPRGARSFKWGTPMVVTFGKPLRFNDEGVSNECKHTEVYEEATAQIMQSIQKLKDTSQ